MAFATDFFVDPVTHMVSVRHQGSYEWLWDLGCYDSLDKAVEVEDKFANKASPATALPRPAWVGSSGPTGTGHLEHSTRTLTLSQPSNCMSVSACQWCQQFRPVQFRNGLEPDAPTTNGMLQSTASNGKTRTTIPVSHHFLSVAVSLDQLVHRHDAPSEWTWTCTCTWTWSMSMAMDMKAGEAKKEV
jgi:hypothetical protein